MDPATRDVLATFTRRDGQATTEVVGTEPVLTEADQARAGAEAARERARVAREPMTVGVFDRGRLTHYTLHGAGPVRAPRRSCGHAGRPRSRPARRLRSTRAGPASDDGPGEPGDPDPPSPAAGRKAVGP